MTLEAGRPVISILVVDDDEATLNLLGTFLRRNGYRVLAASNPVRGLQLLQAEDDIRLVITDLMMPHIDGIGFTRQIHQLEKHKNVPVIMMTAYPNRETYARARELGAGEILTKPFTATHIGMALGRLLPSDWGIDGEAAGGQVLL